MISNNFILQNNFTQNLIAKFQEGLLI